MNTLVVHASKYGSTQQYAEWIATRLGAPVVDSHATSPEDMAAADLVVFCAAIYGPSLRDSVELRRAMEIASATRWILVTVGLSDPDLTDKRDALVDGKFPPPLRDRLRVFHLRGAMDRDRLTFVDRSMMATIRRGLAAKNQRTQEEAAMLAALEPERVDFVDRAALDPVLDACRRV